MYPKGYRGFESLSLRQLVQTAEELPICRNPYAESPRCSNKMFNLQTFTIFSFYSAIF
jgi:hypothetical protein